MVAYLMALDTHQLVMHDYKSQKLMVVLYLSEDSSKKKERSSYATLVSFLLFLICYHFLLLTLLGTRIPLPWGNVVRINI